MAAKTFGAIRSAGTRLEEQEGQKSITPGALGFAGYAGILEKGPVGELILATSRSYFDKVCGGIIEDSLLPDAARDFFSLANGAAGLALVRVTDGNEEKSSINLYGRNADTLVLMGRLDADNGGRWGGKKKTFWSVLDAEGDIDETTIQLPAAVATDYSTDEWKGGYVELQGVPNVRYEIIGNTAAGLITVKPDQTMRQDLIDATAADPPTELNFYLVLENETKALSVLIGDGEEDVDSEFSMTILVDGEIVLTYGNLHTDPDNSRYWVNVINEDGNNDEVIAVDLFTGTHTAATRPANFFGNVVSATANVLTVELFDATVASPTGANPTVALGTTTDVHLRQTLTLTMTSASAFDVVSNVYGDVGSGTEGVEFVSANKYVPPFTITNGATILATGDIITINYKPMPVGENNLVNGLLYPNKGDSKRLYYRIISNDHDTITVQTGVDLSGDTSAGKDFMVSAAIEFAGGVDGNADIVDNDYLNQAWSTDSSPFNDIAGQNLGLVKFGTPGVTATAVQKAGVAYAAAKNHQYRYEIPSNVVTETGALDYINDTVGRSDYAVVSFPSYCDVPHPDSAKAREGQLKTVSAVGMIHGREARIASDFQGYHKAEAGVDATLPRISKIPTGKKKLNEELLNPAGIGVIKKKSGNFVLWGDRTLHTDPAWRFKHKRELMSYYEQVLLENFDFIIFTINDSESDVDAYTALHSFFEPEFTKRAIRGDAFVGGDNPAAIIKVDDELNTDATRNEGDKISSVSLRLADTTERFIIRIGQQGVFEQVA